MDCSCFKNERLSEQEKNVERNSLQSTYTIKIVFSSFA